MSRLGGLARWIASVYAREIPRILREQRWTLLFVAVLGASGYCFGYYSYIRRPTLDAGISFLERTTTRTWSDWLFPFTSQALWGQGWLGFFGPNTVRALLGFLWSVLSVGLVAVRTVWLTGTCIGQVIAISASVSRDASGTGVAGAAVGTLAPHGLLEVPAFLIAWALAFRAGFAWVLPLPGLSRRRSVGRLFRDFRLALFAVLPALFFAALLESYANPIVRDRYLLGIGMNPRMAEERRIGKPFSAVETAWSPDGRRLAALGATSCELVVREVARPQAASVVVDTRGEWILDSPTWSPSGRQVAMVRHQPGKSLQGCQLIVVDVASRHVAVVAGGPDGAYWRAAWSPRGDRIVVTVLGPKKDGLRGPNLWLANARNGAWKRITHFRRGEGVSPVGAPAWRPDGREISFVRLRPKRAVGQFAGMAVWAIAPDGSGLRRAFGGMSYGSIAWSPDSRLIAFVRWQQATGRDSDDSEPGWICLAWPDGRVCVRNLARVDFYSSLSWSPDGSWLAYSRNGTCIIGRPPVRNMIGSARPPSRTP